MGLRTKFNLALIVVFAVGLGLTGFVSYQMLQRNARDEVVQHASIMIEAALAEPGGCSEVVDGRRRITAAPELITGSRHHGVFVEVAWAWHWINLRRYGISSPDADLSPVMAIHPPRRSP